MTRTYTFRRKRYNNGVVTKEFFPVVVTRKRVFSSGACFLFFIHSDNVLVYDSGSVTVIGGSCHKSHFCHDKGFVTTKHIFCRLSQQTFVVTKILWVCHNKYLSRQTWFWLLLPQAYFCVCCDETCLLSRQKYACSFAMTKVLSRQNMTNIILSRQKICHGKHTSVATTDMFSCDKNDICGSSRQW